MQPILLETHFLPFHFDDSQRRIRILLPTDYESNITKHYPVIYFLDGQNILFDDESFSNHSWNLLDALSIENLQATWICVIIDHANERRLDDYCPYQTQSLLQNNLKEFNQEGLHCIDFIINQVKPLVDSTYRSIPTRKYQTMVGSSMSALLGAYISLHHYKTFKYFGLFSMAYPIAYKELLLDIQKTTFKKKVAYQIQCGTKEGQNLVNYTLELAYQLLAREISLKDLNLKINVNHSHSEQSWSKQLPSFLRWLNQHQQSQKKDSN